MSTRFAIGITIHNEERNIGRLLDALQEEAVGWPGLVKVIVVSSGSTDASDRIVADKARAWPAVELIAEARRSGKASAINHYVAAVREVPILVLLSGDVLPAKGAIAQFVAAFADPEVGMVGGRPTPTGVVRTLVHRIARLQWDLHHQVALVSPKLGEAVAFRNVFEAIPADTAVDEAAIEARIGELGLKTKYLPEAVIYNKGPETIRDFLKQRKRIATGHRHLAETSGYSVATTKNGQVLRIVGAYLLRHPAQIPIAFVTAALEAWGRLLGWYDLTVRGKNPYIWDVATSTKDPIGAAEDKR